MMICPDDIELRCAIEIPLHTAKAYALRGVLTETHALDREVAVRTLSQRIMASAMRSLGNRILTSRAIGLYRCFRMIRWMESKMVCR